jgi:hypothetical protein
LFILHKILSYHINQASTTTFLTFVVHTDILEWCSPTTFISPF